MNKTASGPEKLLIVEDDTGLQKQLKWCFSEYDVFVAGDRESALAQLHEHHAPVIILDLGLPPDPANATEGLAALEQILAIAADSKIIIVTGNDDQENALKSIHLGAYDFYQKPVQPDILKLIVDRAYRLYALEQENKRLINEQGITPLQDVISSSSAMLEVCSTITKVAPTDVSVLLLGESGTGKELLARALHDMGLRKDAPFIAINCAAIPENLLESELFGYEKGAFTGAAKQTLGKIEYANGGTLFLDEVGDLPLSLQAKLLRFIQERVIERVGGRKEIPIDVRIVCATHQDLGKKIEMEEYREDLYYRISEISINIPPLRDRPEDAIMLAQHFLDLYRKNKKQKLSKDALKAIEEHSWTGNARELENMVKRAVILAETNLIKAGDLGLTINSNSEFIDLKTARDKAEYEVIEKALNRYQGKITKAAKHLGVSRPTLYDLIEKHGLKH